MKLGLFRRRPFTIPSRIASLQITQPRPLPSSPRASHHTVACLSHRHLPLQHPDHNCAEIVILSETKLITLDCMFLIFMKYLANCCMLADLNKRFVVFTPLIPPMWSKNILDISMYSYLFNFNRETRTRNGTEDPWSYALIFQMCEYFLISSCYQLFLRVSEKLMLL